MYELHPDFQPGILCRPLSVGFVGTPLRHPGSTIKKGTLGWIQTVDNAGRGGDFGHLILETTVSLPIDHTRYTNACKPADIGVGFSVLRAENSSLYRGMTMEVFGLF